LEIRDVDTPPLGDVGTEKNFTDQRNSEETMRLLFLAAAIVLASCFDSMPSIATFNVYFWYPNDSKEYYLGTAIGLDQCGAVAANHAISKNLKRDDGWAYICCLKTSSSECAEKHR
jgi:hypothetical protein